MPISPSSAQTRTNVSPAFFERNARRVRRVGKWSKKFRNWHAISTMIILFAYLPMRHTEGKTPGQGRTHAMVCDRQPTPKCDVRLDNIFISLVIRSVELFDILTLRRPRELLLRRLESDYEAANAQTVLCRCKLYTIASHLCALSKRLNTHRN